VAVYFKVSDAFQTSSTFLRMSKYISVIAEHVPLTNQNKLCNIFSLFMLSPGKINLKINVNNLFIRMFWCSSHHILSLLAHRLLYCFSECRFFIDEYAKPEQQSEIQVTRAVSSFNLRFVFRDQHEDVSLFLSSKSSNFLNRAKFLRKRNFCANLINFCAR
jgi:hypothetical protein